MVTKYKVGDVLSGTVTGTQPYGAFVALDEQTQGLIHISEITYGYVKDISDFLTIGQEVEVKILDIDETADKISLSVRELQDKPSSKKRECIPRKTLQDRVDENEANGFRALKGKLNDWIEQSRH